MTEKVALVTGSTGMDGSNLSEILLDEGYEVYGLVRHSATPNYWRLEKALRHPKFHMIHGDLTDSASITEVGLNIKGRHKNAELEIYNLGAQSFVGISWSEPMHTMDVNVGGTVNLLEFVRKHWSDARYYFAASSEIFGKCQPPQCETSNFIPRSPYGISKLAAHWMTVNYRESYNIFASSGILFNHSSPRRGLEFFEQKVADGVAQYLLHKTLGWFFTPLKLGNLNAKRDIGHSIDYCRAMWMMLQHDESDTFVIATGKTYSMRDIVTYAFTSIGVPPLIWIGNGIDEKAYIGNDLVVEIDPKFFRPAEVDVLLGDATKARTVLGWQPEYCTSIEQLIGEMVSARIEARKKGTILYGGE